MKVIDISDWNENIDWQALKNNGVEGVIIKVSEGIYTAELFYKHIYESRDNGMKIGIYCFSRASTRDQAIQEADNAIRQMESSGVEVTLGIWFDAESDELKNSGDATGIAAAFIRQCNILGYSAGIYASYDWLTNVLDVSSFPSYVQYWVAQYGDTNSFSNEHPDKIIAGWQYTDSYDIEGTKYDMSIWY